jgi:hypothetical protein
VIVTSLPFLQMAGFLSATPPAAIALLAAYIIAWLAALALCTPLLRDHRARLRAVALATALILGGPVLWYIGAEFGARPAAGTWAAWLGPLMGALMQLREPPILVAPWITMATVIAICILARSRASRRH